ncbi:MAG: CRISPR-associated endonuclease Cas2 [Acidimicrobiales bacterium]
MGREWMVTYDISRNASRSKLATMLEARGPRVLYSVFEIEADAAGMIRLATRASELLGPTDAVLALPRCESCRSWRYGRGIELDPRERTSVVVW